LDRWGRRVDSSRLIPMKPHGRLSDSAANRSLLVHLINVEPDPDWIMRSAVIEGLKLLAAYDLTF
jgi:hypothetical protein